MSNLQTSLLAQDNKERLDALKKISELQEQLGGVPISSYLPISVAGEERRARVTDLIAGNFSFPYTVTYIPIDIYNNGTSNSTEIKARLVESINSGTPFQVDGITRYTVQYSVGYTLYTGIYEHTLGIGTFGSGAQQVTFDSLKLINTEKFVQVLDPFDLEVTTSISDSINNGGETYVTSEINIFRRTINGEIKVFVYLPSGYYEPEIGGTGAVVSESDFTEITNNGGDLGSGSDIEPINQRTTGNIQWNSFGDLPNVAFTENDEPQPIFDALNARPLTLIPNGSIHFFSTLRITATSSTTAKADKRFWVLRTKITNNADATGVYYGTGSGLTLSSSNMKLLRFERYQLDIDNGVVTGTTVNDLGNIGAATVEDVINTSGPFTPVNNFTLFRSTDGTTESFNFYQGDADLIGVGETQITANDLRLVDPNDSDIDVSEVEASSSLSIQDENGVPLFSVTDSIRVSGFDIDESTKKLINPITLPEFNITDKFEMGALAGTSGDLNRLLITQPISSGTPTTFEAFAMAQQSGSSWFSHLIFSIFRSGSGTIAERKLQILKLTEQLVTINSNLQANYVLSLSGFEGRFFHLDEDSLTTVFICRNTRTNDHRLKINAGYLGGGLRYKLFEFVNDGNQPIYRFSFDKTNLGSGFKQLALEIDGSAGVGNYKTTLKGSLKMDKLDLSALGSYADDAAAATGGVEIGFAYINSSSGAVHRRLT